MKKKAFIFFQILIFVTIVIGCEAFNSNIDIPNEFNGKSENIANITNVIIKEYNKKYGAQIEKNEISIYSIKPYEKGFLILICYKNASLELKLLYLTKDKDNYHISKYSDGEYDIKKLKVNKVEEGNNAIYFGSLDNSFFKNNDMVGSKVYQGGITILLDDGENFQEKINNNQKGYIIILNRKAMIVDFYLYNLENVKSYFINNFINYSNGINESLWK